MTTTFSGGCLCGAVRFQGSGEAAVCGHCQCSDCRRSSGTGHGSHMAMAADAVGFEGETKAYERAADSGNLVRRFFCPTGGSPIYSTNSGMPGLVFIRASSLDDPELFTPQLVVYTSRGASWDLIDPALASFETMPPDAMPV